MKFNAKDTFYVLVIRQQLDVKLPRQSGGSGGWPEPSTLALAILHGVKAIFSTFS